jgi:Heparinase II/III-like protein/Heparinase II/III N-terminus
MAEGSISSSRVRRLLKMDRAEIVDRLRQQVVARLDLFRFSLGHDFAKFSPEAKPGADEHGHFFFSSADLPAICDFIKRDLPAQVDEMFARARRICEHRFDLLGYENIDYGHPIDWRLDAVHGKHAPKIAWFKIRYLDFEQVGDAKVTWELNRHQHFVTLAKAYLFTADPAFAAEVFSQWEQWWAANPYPKGLNWASTLEVAFRVQSWIWTFFLLQSCPLFTAQLRSEWEARLHLCGRHIEKYLSTYFSPNTHLLGEALALFSLGTLFPSPSAKRWREKGWAILVGEAGRQVRDDGFYFEQSTYYHVYAVDMLLHARILAARNGIAIPEAFQNNLERMLDALLLLSRAGLPHMFGDDDGGRVFDASRNRSTHMLDPLATGAILYQRGDFKSVVQAVPEETLWLLGANAGAEFESIESKSSHTESMALTASGLYLMFDATEKQQLLIDAGPLGSASGGHGHADALSVSLIRGGRELLRDSGTFEYVGPRPERARLRGTAAHNTLRVDGRDQAEMTGPFSWASLPSVRVERWINGKHFDLFEGSHSGYSRPHAPMTHRRQVFHARGEFWIVRDVVEGEGEHQIEIAWHPGPGLALVEGTEFLFSDGEENFAILTEESQGWTRAVRDFSWSPVYGKTAAAQVATFAARRELPAEHVTILAAGKEAAKFTGRVVKVSDSAVGAFSAWRYLDDRRECSFIFSRPDSPWQFGAWSGDADFLYASIDRQTLTRRLVFCGGTYLNAGENRVLSCSRRVSYAEVWSSAGATEVLSSDPEAVTLDQSLDRVWPEVETTATGQKR